MKTLRRRFVPSRNMGARADIPGRTRATRAGERRAAGRRLDSPPRVRPCRDSRPRVRLRSRVRLQLPRARQIRST